MTQTPLQTLAGNTFNLTNNADNPDIITGTADDDTFVAVFGTLNVGDRLNGGAGNDTLQLGYWSNGNGYSSIPLSQIAFTGIETILGSDQNDLIDLDGGQLQDIRVINGGGGTFNSLNLRGATIDLTGKTITAFRSISLVENGSTITVDNVATAKLMWGNQVQNDHLILTQGTLTNDERNQLHAQGIDKITVGSVTTENKAPFVANLDGDLAFFVSNTAVRLDTGAAATLTNDDETLSYLSVRVLNRRAAGDAIGIDVSGGDIKLSDGMNTGSKISVQTPNGWVEIAGINVGPGFLGVSLYDNAGTSRVQTLLRALTYQSASGELAETLRIQLSLLDPGGRESVSIMKVVRPNNMNPTVAVDGVTSFTVKEGTAFSALLTTSDDIANEVSVSFDGAAPNGGNAGGLFVIEGGRLKLAPGRALDYDALATGQKSVTVYLKATDTEGGTTTQAVTINVTNDSNDDGTDGPDILIGGDESESLTGKGGNDVVRGNGGDDTLSGGLGNDMLDGGAGKDVFVFDAKLSKTNTLNKKQNLDKIVDFVVADDTIHLAKSVFAKITKKGVLKKSEFYIGSAAHDRDDHVIYNKKTGALWYDPDGNGAKEAIQFATLSKNLKLTNLDFFVV
ncbi:calcium-binding protein [Microvirga calopogonii]|uniref:calcium-binding protein n=1 Tax=Microvirga calopogonii TaxID=2078013 RepID=UPI000E0D969F|nr:calcium-binding protein [Microvirga calopogonii]